MKKLIKQFIGYCQYVSKRFIKFGIVGVSGTIVDLGIIALLNNLFGTAAFDTVIRNIVQLVGYEGSVISNFLLSFFWVWKDRQGHFSSNFLKYNLSTALAFLIRLGFFNLGLVVTAFFFRNNWFTYYAVWFLSFGVSLIINFLLINHKVFSGKEKNGDKSEAKHRLTDVQ